MELADRVAATDPSTIRAVATAACGGPVDVVGAWSSAQLSYRVLTYITGGLFRVAGTAQRDGSEIAWSAILKVCHPPSEEALAQIVPERRPALRETMLWDREALAYESGMLHDLAPGLVAPRLLRVDRFADEIWLWLEEIVADETEPWTIERYALTARHLGRFNGRNADASIPGYQWLSRDWLHRTGLRWDVPPILQDDRLWSAPELRDRFPVNARERLTAIWDERDQLALTAAGLPHSLAHLDAHRGNLIGRRDASGSAETVLIDWSYVGSSCLGSDLAQLVFASLYFYGEPLAHDALESATTKGYLAGLAESGCRVDPLTVRRGYIVSALARWTLLWGQLAGVYDPAARARLPDFDRFLTKAGDRCARLLALRDELGASG